MINVYHTDNGIFNTSKFLEYLLKKKKNIRFSGDGASLQNVAAERAIKTVVTMVSVIFMKAWMICNKDKLSIYFGQHKWDILYGSKVGLLIYITVYKPLRKIEPYMIWSQGYRSLYWKPLYGTQWVKEDLIWDLERLFNTSWVEYEYYEWFNITSVSYYLDDILYSIVIITSPDKEVYVGNLPDGYTKTGPLPRVNTRVNQSGLSLAKPGRAMASAMWNMANQGSTWQLLQRII